MPYSENKERTDAVQPAAPQSDDFLLCADGTYRWVYELPMRKSFFLLFVCLSKHHLCGKVPEELSCKQTRAVYDQ